MRWIRVGALTVASATMVLAGTGCADSESMLFVRQVQARLATGSSVCAADSSPTSPSLGEGVLDVAFRTRYTAALLVGSQLVPRGDNAQLRTETSRVDIQGSIVRAIDDAGNVAWGPVTVPGSGFIEPANGSNPSFGLTETTLFQANAALVDDLRMNGGVRHDVSIVKVFGRTLGGTVVESGEWQFPVSVCYRCLISFPTAASTSTAARNCDLPVTTGSTVSTPCDPGQDDLLDCRVCKEVFPDSSICDPPP